MLFTVMLFLVPIAGGVALAALAARVLVRATTRRDGASAADPHLAAAELARTATAEDAAEEDVRAATAAQALAAAGSRLEIRATAGTVRTWLASPDLEHPRRLLAHEGTEEAYEHVRDLADLAEHPQREEISRRIRDALDRAESPARRRRVRS